MKKHLLTLFVMMAFGFGFAQTKNSWTKSSSTISAGKQTVNSRITTEISQFFDLDFSGLKQSLVSAKSREESRSQLTVSFPSADGSMKAYNVMEASTLHPDLAAKYPGIKSYAGQGIDDPTSTIRFSLSDQAGFHGMILSGNEGVSYIDPHTTDGGTYKVYARNSIDDLVKDFECSTDESADFMSNKNGVAAQKTDDKKLRKYRLALACTAEYGNLFAGSGTDAQKIANILAQMNITMTRVNGVYERDLAITMEIVASNDAVMYFGSTGSDPWSSEYNSKTQQTIDANIGDGNYDIGHLFVVAGDNGNAGCIGCVCTSGSKGSAFTSRGNPTGDAFDIDFVAHEMGHQFGGYHTMNTCSRSGNGSTEVEPASGSSIMGYAGICSSNVQSNSDAHFSYVNIRDISANVQSGTSSSCAQVINLSNNPPIANAGANYSIPKSTPFILRGQGSDPDGDAITYTWAQNDPEQGAGNGSPSSTWTQGPMFRARLGSSSPDRYMPQISDVVAGNLTPTWEVVPSVARSMEFSLVVRDNAAGGGQTSDDLMSVSVVNVTPFTMSSPNTSVTWNAGTIQTVTWNVGSTNSSPINSANMNILLSTDGGLTYPITLLSNTPNDGSADISVPNNISTTCRVMVAAADNIFYDISNTNFAIEGTVVCNADVPTNLASSNVGSASADISWTAVPGATYDVRHKATSSATWTTTAVSGISTSLSGLNILTQYEVQVRSTCDGGATSAYSSSVNFTTTEVQLNYCSSNGNSVADEYIGRVQLGTIDNASGAGAGGYADHTGLSTNLSVNASATITITPTWTGTIYNEGYSVWIDYNKDGDFADSGEQVWTAAASKTTPVSGSFTVPSSATEGSTRMRVSMKYNGVPTSCEAFSYGEVEDYTVVIGSLVDTTAPVITLVGNATINLNVGDTYTEEGATATDNVDGDLTSSIETTGTVNTASAGTHTVNYNVSDAAGNAAAQVSRTVIVTADTTAPVITLVGNATINLNVGDTYTEQGATATDNVDGDLTSNIVSTGTVNTAVAATYTVNYNVSDAAGNAASEVSRSVVVTEVPSGCEGGINSFPYSEGFESGIGAWTQSSSDDINWTVDASGTPSSSTGPSSATEGGNYLYIESSGNGTGYPNKVAILNSPCIDLTGETGATFSFSYHMYGSSMGTMDLQASIDGTNWTSLWSMSGNQGNAWTSASVDLLTYAGATVELRYVGITSTSYRSDMAIDKLSLTAGAPAECNDVTLTLVVDQYPEETSWAITDGGGATLASGAYTNSTPDGSTVIENACLPTGCYTFTINDAYGDGICCTYGNGSYNLNDDGSGSLLASGGSFTSSQATNFCVGGASARSTTNVERFEPSNQARLYPNPVSNYLYVNTPSDVVSIRVITVSGTEMNKVRISNNGIDVSSLKSGIYMVLIQTEKALIKERFVKH